MPTWFLLTITATIFWAIAQILLKKGFAHVTPLWNNVFSIFFRLIIWVPAVLILSNFSLNIPSLLNLFIIFVIACSYMLLLYALSKGKLALTGTLVALAPVVTTILSITFLNEQPKTWQSAGIISVISGALLLAYPDKKDLKNITTYGWIFWGLLTAFATGTGDFLTKISVNMIGANSHIFFLALTMPFVLIVNFLIDKKGRTPPKLSVSKLLPTITGSAILFFGSLFYFLSFDHGPASLISPVASFYSILTVILAIIFLKEKINLRQGIGVVLGVLGVILIGL